MEIHIEANGSDSESMGEGIDVGHSLYYNSILDRRPSTTTGLQPKIRGDR